jgi:hypothetical protein
MTPCFAIFEIITPVLKIQVCWLVLDVSVDLGLLDPAGESTMILRNVVRYKSLLRRYQSSCHSFFARRSCGGGGGGGKKKKFLH